MRFEPLIATLNLRRKTSRSILMIFAVIILSIAVFAGSYLVLSLRQGLASYRARLGADIVVVPSSSKGHGSVDDIFLQGITGNYYISAKDLSKVEATEGIETMTRQFYLTSAKASCCSTRIQIIGIDPDTDFTIQPWIRDNYSGSLNGNEVIVGNSVSAEPDETVKFYGKSYRVMAKLDRTGTGLDSAVFTDMNTIRQMAQDAGSLAGDAFKDKDIDTCASSVLIKVRDGYNIEEVADDINIHITKVEATPSRTMISGISEGLGNLSGVVGVMSVLIFLLAVVILAVVYALLTNERCKEFAVLRTLGASGRMLFKIMSFESLYIGAIGSVAGMAVAMVILYILKDSLQEALGLPFLTPGAGVTALIAVITLIVSIMTGIIISYVFARKVINSDTGLLIKEED